MVFDLLLTSFFVCFQRPSSHKQKGHLMADPSLIEQLKQGVPAWNEWKAKQPRATDQLLDLSDADDDDAQV